jgi:hypothetical protein
VDKDGGVGTIEADGQPIKIEIEPVAGADLAEIYGDDETRGSDRRVLTAGRALFDEALDLVDACAAAVAERIDAMAFRRPDEYELQLAIKVDGKAGARIVEVSAGAQLQVTLRWKAVPPDGR